MPTIRLEIITVDIAQRNEKNFEFKVESTHKEHAGQNYIRHIAQALGIDQDGAYKIIKEYNARPRNSKSLISPAQIETPFDFKLEEDEDTQSLLLFKIIPDNWSFHIKTAADGSKILPFVKSAKDLQDDTTWNENFDKAHIFGDINVDEVCREFCVLAKNSDRAGVFNYDLHLLIEQHTQSGFHTTPVTIDPKIRNTP